MTTKIFNEISKAEILFFSKFNEMLLDIFIM